MMTPTKAFRKGEASLWIGFGSVFLFIVALTVVSFLL